MRDMERDEPGVRGERHETRDERRALSAGCSAFRFHSQNIKSETSECQRRCVARLDSGRHPRRGSNSRLTKAPNLSRVSGSARKAGCVSYEFLVESVMRNKRQGRRLCV